MWIKRTIVVRARMPSTRNLPLNPSVAAAAKEQRKPGAQLEPSAAAREGRPAAKALARDKASRSGGFHESSYELKDGLEVSESDWPPEIPEPKG
jgi:hypothetical protein